MIIYISYMLLGLSAFFCVLNCVILLRQILGISKTSVFPMFGPILGMIGIIIYPKQIPGFYFFLPFILDPGTGIPFVIAILGSVWKSFREGESNNSK